MNIFTPIETHARGHSIDQGWRGVMMDRFNPPLLEYSPFPMLPGLSGQMLRDITASGNVDINVVGFQLAAVMSLLTQGSANVVWPNGKEMTIGVNVWLSAPSWSCTSSILEIFMKPIQEDLATRRSADSTSRHGRFLIDGDVPFEAMAQILRKHSIAGYFTEEPGKLKKMLKSGSKWAKFLDGTLHGIARDPSKSIEPCLTIFSTDESDESDAKTLRDAIKKGGAVFLNYFFLARLSNPHLGSSLHRVGLSIEVLHAYRKKVEERLNFIFRQNNLWNVHELPTITLSPDAAECLDHINDVVRSNCAPETQWASVAWYGAEHIQRVTRIAGSIHVFEYGAEGEISLDTLQCADAIGRWCIESVLRTIYEPPKLTQAEFDAAVLEKGLISLYFSEACRTHFFISDIRTHALGLGLTPARFTRALALLGKQNKVRPFPHLNRRCVEILCVPEFSRISPYLRTVPGSFA